ncbi:olfactory receptor Olr1214-like protein [Camelus ferus]|nr:olfactory receptor Olr1214-like protein [Camelus ferus]
MLMSFANQHVISYAGCMAQLYFFSFFVIDECCILTSMAYDRYVAICKPLLYKVTMSHQVCLLLTVGSYAMGLVGATAHTGCMLRLSFCDGNIINHYMCDIPPLLRLSCTSTYINELVVFIVVGINVIVPSLTISISYTLILSSILRIRSTEGRSKAFSTCSSHIIVVSLFFGSSAFMYLKPFPAGSLDQDKVTTVFYTIVGPMMNPFIYSLRNKDVQVALKGYLLTTMAYDRYVAICSPLLYNVIMSHRVCSMMTAVVYSLGLFGATVHTTRITHINEILLFIIGGVNTLAPTLAVLISYVFILSSILRIRSAEGRSKACGTCSSHLVAVGIFLGSITFMYFKPPSGNNMEQEKVSSVFYTTVIPMLNPLIYSLRNKDVKNALRRVVGERLQS